MDRLKSLMDALRKLATDPSSMSTSVCVPQTRQSRTTYIPTRARRGKAFGETVKPVRAASPGRLALEGRRAQAYHAATMAMYSKPVSGLVKIAQTSGNT